MNMNNFFQYLGKSAFLMCGLMLTNYALSLNTSPQYFVGVGVGLLIGAYWKAIE